MLYRSKWVGMKVGVENKIPFAIRLNTGEMVSVDEVPSGLDCGCKCPSCDGRLVARKGPKNVHHFGHHDKSQEGCQYAFETSVRLMLLDKLDEVIMLNTPARMVRFEGVLHKVSSSHTNIMVTRIAQSNQLTPTATYALQERPDFGLGLYFPAVNEPRDPPPEWLVGHTSEHPKTGILVVNYLAFAAHIFSDQRPAGMDTTTWLLSILSVQPECLSWMYHPADERVLVELQTRSDERKRLEEITQAKERERLLANLKRQAGMEELASHQHEAWRQQEQHRVNSLLVRRLEVAKACPTLKQSPLLYCAYCYQQATELSPEGFCYRERCMSRRHRHLLRSSARPATVGELRKVFKKDQLSAPKPMINEYGEKLCAHCDAPIYRLAGKWWCEECGQTIDAEYCDD